ncbi:unannotated protein [freshwater metagenome]|uniref:Unannotated protein n=1 Tax=freshwater metagenome TaxID=449393 RepID=A0A6J7KN56_9ZZZZ
MVLRVEAEHSARANHEVVDVRVAVPHRDRVEKPPARLLLHQLLEFGSHHLLTIGADAPGSLIGVHAENSRNRGTNRGSLPFENRLFACHCAGLSAREVGPVVRRLGGFLSGLDHLRRDQGRGCWRRQLGLRVGGNPFAHRSGVLSGEGRLLEMILAGDQVAPADMHLIIGGDVKAILAVLAPARSGDHRFPSSDPPALLALIATRRLTRQCREYHEHPEHGDDREDPPQDDSGGGQALTRLGPIRSTDVVLRGDAQDDGEDEGHQERTDQ